MGKTSWSEEVKCLQVVSRAQVVMSEPAMTGLGLVDVMCARGRHSGYKLSSPLSLAYLKTKEFPLVNFDFFVCNLIFITVTEYCCA